jgi:hypothetical protein
VADAELGVIAARNDLNLVIVRKSPLQTILPTTSHRPDNQVAKTLTP